MTNAAAPARRVGVFGGAFDPPHRAHVALAEAAVAQLQLDELKIVPTGQAWHKSRVLTPPEHRIAMARLAFAGIAPATVDARETERAGPSFTIDTLQALKAEAPDSQLFLIIGGDQFASLGQWHRWPDIVQLATICIANRDDPERAEGIFDLKRPLPPGFMKLDFLPTPLSATAIRKQLASGGRTAEELAALVPEAVARYISQHRLYNAV